MTEFSIKLFGYLIMLISIVLTGFVMLLVLTGCISEDHKAKVYRNKINFCQPEKLKVLYSENIAEEYYDIDFNAEIAEIELNTQRLRKINANTDDWVAGAQEELKKARAELDRRESRMTEQEKQCQQIKEMKKELKELDARIEKIKLKKEKRKNGH